METVSDCPSNYKGNLITRVPEGVGGTGTSEEDVALSYGRTGTGFRSELGRGEWVRSQGGGVFVYDPYLSEGVTGINLGVGSTKGGGTGRTDSVDLKRSV